MKIEKVLPISFALLGLEALLALGWLLYIPGDPNNAFLLGRSPTRLGMAVGLLLAAALFAAMALRGFNQKHLPAIVLEVLGFFSRPFGLCVLLAVFSLSLFALLNWRYVPDIYQARLLRLAPALLFATLLSTHLLVLDGWRNLDRSRVYAKFGTLTIVLLATYLAGTITFSQHNAAFDVSDQAAYIDFASLVRRSNFNYTGARNFMPAYPYLQALFIEDGQIPEVVYARGKLVNIGLSLLLLAGLFLIVKLILPQLQAFWFTLLAAYSIFIYKAAYFQPEILFYFLFFVAFMLMARHFVQPDSRLAALLGVAIGLGQLTKATMLPAIALFIVFSVIRILWGWRQSRSELSKQLASVAAVMLLFLLTVSSYILESKREYGQYFYNTNTTFYAWYDSWREAKAGTRAHGDGQGWPDLPQEQIPSPAKYLREHSLSDILDRFARGLSHQAQNISLPFSWISYPLIYIGMTALIGLLDRHRASLLLKRYASPAAFVTLFVLGYTLLFAWYSPIADYSDMRFTFALHLPILFTCFFVLNKLLEDRPAWLFRVHAFAAILLVSELIFILPQKLIQFQWYGK